MGPSWVNLIAFISLFIGYGTFAQTVVSFDSDQWTYTNPGEVVKETYKMQKSVMIKKGKAFIKDVEFANGIIEFDVCMQEGRNFGGVIFRVQDEQNYEVIYMRSHQSGNPDANQYTPVFKGQSGWQLYYGNGHGAPVKYDFDEWMHVKVVVKGNKGEVYFRNEEKPSLLIHELKRKVQTGYLGLTGSFRYANFSYQVIENPELLGEFETINPPAKEVIQNWKVSQPFSKSELSEQLDNAKLKAMEWQETEVESKGLLNIARYNEKFKEANTAFVKVTIISDTDQAKKVTFGYSDMARVYCNGKILYSGNRRYRSQDYRYLGTIGYFDSVYLPLKKGENELVISITENFGGWGVQAQFENLDGIEVK